MEKTKAHGDIDDLVKLSFFVDVGKAIASARTLKQILERVMRQIGAIFAPRNWSLLLIGPNRTELVFKIVVGESADKLTGARVPIDQGIGGWIYRNGLPAIVEDVRRDSRFNPKVDEVTGFITQSVIGVPLKTDQEVLGVIELINKLDGTSFTPFELKVLSTIADFAAIAIEKSFYIQALRRQSRYDHLTGVLNRRSLDRILAREITRAKRYKETLAVLLIDIDDFKKINDTHGHPMGDEVLKNCAAALQKVVRKLDHVARFGGDEFAVIMPCTGPYESNQARRRVLAAIEKAAHECAVPYTVSVGIQAAGPDGVDDVLKKSDLSLYRQKSLKPPFRIDEHLIEFYDDESEEV